MKLAGDNSAQPFKARRVLAYHEIAWGQSNDVYQLRPANFIEQVLSAAESSRAAGVELEFTFDDAHTSHVNIAAPLLTDAGFTGRFFVPSSWVGKRPHVASWNGLRALVQEGHRIGSHGRTHQLLTSCSTAVLREELLRSRLDLENGLGVPVHTISMPGGRCNRRVAAAAISAGYRAIYTSCPRTAPPSHLQLPLAIIGRFAVCRQTSLSTIQKFIIGDPLVCTTLFAKYQARHLLKVALGDPIYQALWRRLLRRSADGSSNLVQPSTVDR